MYIIRTAPPPLPLPLPLLPALWPAFSGFDASNNNGTSGDGPGGELPSNWSSLIGIVTAIVGNVLIALALNVQRYAHIQLHKEQQRNRERARQALRDAANGNGGTNKKKRQGGSFDSRAGHGNGNGGRYGAVEGSGSGNENRHNESDGHEADDEGDTNSDGHPAHESDPLTADYHRDDSESRKSTLSDSDPNSLQSKSYLRSPYWWLGQVLITIGEMGNFLAYGFAPASIVSPLGVVALISNCVIAPILFKESFRKRDFGGVVIAIAGAVTVVLSAKQEETKLNPHDVWDAITTAAFEIYVGVTCGLIALLMWASPRYGNRSILIDLGLVGLFGGYTVLATKGVSSMLSSTLLGAFLTPMTYVLLIILLGTAVMQVRYVNKALQRFDSTQVIPIQFVMFTLCVIIGSAVLYRDFERTTVEQAAKFVGGCLLTFFGVFVITSGRPSTDDDEDDDDDLSVADGPGESINLAAQANNGEDGAPQTPTGRSTVRHGSRRSSRASRVNFVGTLTNRPLSLATETGVPSQRTPLATPSLAATSVPRISEPHPPQDADAAGDYLTYKDDQESGGEEPTQPLLENPWRSASFSSPVSGSPLDAAALSTPAGAFRPSLGPSPVSADAVLHAIGTGDNAPAPSSPAPPQADRPVTPSAVLRPHQTPSQYFHQSPMISPSPLLSSTMSAVMADTILQHLDGGSPQAVRRPSTRRVRPSLRSSLFVPQDELLLDDAERLLHPSTVYQNQNQNHNHNQNQNHPYRYHQHGGSLEAFVTGPSIPHASRPATSTRVGTSVAGPSGTAGPSSGAADRRDVQTSGGPSASSKVEGATNSRARARSLSTTLGGLFWSRRKSSANNGEGRTAGSNNSTSRNNSEFSQDDYTASDDLPPPSAAVTESEAEAQPERFF
ncbi:uncharacterized protein SPSK_07021 [Sporothrix schenckii 1099-18]|uniref:DUF803 domain membrane protein n=1 Tax=Sporothrix schenckii 1099-18 TaxID=1397361 RepID=A0A0F2MII1_SPOSC|nr:uncharacterized protein SPSK_07021 [Sporothrix schenckii 1099-18]KJR88660.1 hypothetical protein SPSK_07021 [Sporothrix schenckii 1099-18]